MHTHQRMKRFKFCVKVFAMSFGLGILGWGQGIEATSHILPQVGTKIFGIPTERVVAIVLIILGFVALMVLLDIAQKRNEAMKHDDISRSDQDEM